MEDMRVKSFLLLFASFAFFHLHAQVFVMDELLNEVDVLTGCKHKKNEVWAENIVKLNHFDENGNIFYQYVIPLEDSIKVSTLIALTSTYFDNADKGRFVSSSPIQEEGKVPTLEGYEHLGILETSLAGYTLKNRQKVNQNIQGLANYIIQFKEDRIRISVISKDYSVTYSTTGNDPIPDIYTNKKVDIIDRPPFTKMKMGNAQWYASFINLNSRCFFNLIGKYVDYINSEYPKLIKSISAKEKIKNEDW